MVGVVVELELERRADVISLRSCSALSAISNTSAIFLSFATNVAVALVVVVPLDDDGVGSIVDVTNARFRRGSFELNVFSNVVAAESLKAN